MVGIEEPSKRLCAAVHYSEAFEKCWSARPQRALKLPGASPTFRLPALCRAVVAAVGQRESLGVVRPEPGKGPCCCLMLSGVRLWESTIWTSIPASHSTRLRQYPEVVVIRRSFKGAAASLPRLELRDAFRKKPSQRLEVWPASFWATGRLWVHVLRAAVAYLPRFLVGSVTKSK